MERTAAPEPAPPVFRKVAETGQPPLTVHCPLASVDTTSKLGGELEWGKMPFIAPMMAATAVSNAAAPEIPATMFRRDLGWPAAGPGWVGMEPALSPSRPGPIAGRPTNTCHPVSTAQPPPAFRANYG